MSYHDLLEKARETLDDPNPQEAFFLLLELCNQLGIDLYSSMDEECSESFAEDFLEKLGRLEKQEPLAYILNNQPFYGYDFFVDERVLIPRPETEELCSLILMLSDELFDKEPIIVFDVASGSGAIAITLDKEEDRFDVFGSDLSEEALEVARINNKNLKASVNFLQGDLYAPFIDRNMKCDILVCNPPYIPAEEEIAQSVRGYEPHMALFGGEDGMDFYRKLFTQAHKILNKKYLCAFEMGWNQGEVLKKLAVESFPEAVVEIHQDLSGKNRMLTITNLKNIRD